MKYVFIFCCLLIMVACNAQTEGRAKLYGFVESVSPGANTSAIEEGGETINHTKAGRNYLLYLQSSTRVYPSEVWIMGKAYGVSYQTIKTPVERQPFTTPAENSKQVLVPATTDKVLQLTPLPAIPDKLSDKGASLATTNELVVVYRQGGNFYYNALKTLKPIEAVAAQ